MRFGVQVQIPRVPALVVLVASLAGPVLSASGAPSRAGARDEGVASARSTPSAAETARVAAPASAPLVLVLPFSARADAEPDWLSWGIAEFIGEGMSLAGYRVVDPDAREDALDATGLDAEKRLTLASACELGRRVGARYVVTGTWRSESSKLAFTAKIIDVERLKLVRESSASAHVSLIAPALGGIVVDVTGDSGRAPAARREIEKLSGLGQEALMAWMQAAAESENATQHLTAALSADSGFVRARLDLAEAQLAAARPEAVPATLRSVPVDAALAHRARAKVLLGRATLAMGDAKAALPLLSEGAQLDPQPEHVLWVAEAQLATGDRAGAADSARRVLSMLPGDEHAQDVLDQAEGRAPTDDSLETTDSVEPR
jgi:TolB-like protein